MSVLNNLVVTGKLKNIKEFNQYGLMVVGQLTQKNGTERAKFTIPVVTHDEKIAQILRGLQSQTSEGDYTPELVVSGRLDTKFDVRRDVAQADRRAPMTRILIESIEVVQ